MILVAAVLAAAPDDVPAELYLWSVDVEVPRAVGPEALSAELSGFRYTWSGQLRVAAVREFRDQTRGLLVRVDGSSPLGGLGMELRGFPGAAPLDIAGLGAAPYTGVELLDPLWLGLSPPIDPRTDAVLKTSWAMDTDGTQPVTWRWTARCAPGEEPRTQRCAGNVVLAAERIWALGDRGVWLDEGLGELEVEARFARRRQGGSGSRGGGLPALAGRRGLERWMAVGRRVLRSRWPSGEVVEQEVVVRAAVQRVGVSTLTAPLPEPAVVDLVADRAPLRFADGVVPAPGPAPEEALPFLVLPPDLPRERRDAVRALLLGRGMLGVEEPSP